MRGSRVLVVRVGAMGDVLHALPAVAALRQQWPEATVDWVVDPRWAPLLVDGEGRGPVVSGVHLAETRGWSRAPLSLATAKSVFALRAALEAGRYGWVVDVQGTTRSAVLGRMAQAEQFVGFAHPREWPARLLYRRTAERCGVHVVEQNAALLSVAMGVVLKPRVPLLPVSHRAEAWVDGLRLRTPFALLAPSAGWGAKQWPAERFGALAQVLAASGFQVLVNAATAADDLALDVVRCSNGAAEMAACSVEQMIALMRRAALVVGGDSGPVHMAAALGRPLVAVFGPTDPARNGPWGPGAKRVLRDKTSVTSHKRVSAVDAGLARLSVAAVVEAAEEVLAE